ncbi:hypothetical protein DFH09DRAFT_1310698 [Mycena vulgaris]|nr:hypothetical protein DFH09DRAFT_1310698 [Mycena vulgaris]
MFAIRIASLLLATSFVSASPSPFVTRASTADFRRLINRYSLSSSAVSSGTATDEIVTPLINDLTAALDTATAALTGIPIISLSAKSNNFDAEMQDVTNALDGLLSTASTIPADVDVAPPGLARP